ncbi:branched-chain amino acid aminotransferase (ilvE) [Pyrobaculum aerophilum str. IM2]|uniref:Branched-chain-amino-acid aminotransferase n=2 Tax=Pyrobaculum aerophilum TaxID=13773 RepID=Q8ZTE2_PYRAE|nr:branched-chain amino acid transaminase [Pyrobaculum aerophilum]AAL64820.1 branched-chain amino acid aminotransferase (ilvE) [Pyrobaculum aerophilum str. IM2]HII47569.1 branched-chain amino acid transaminase [Pyrobaculum aerophilum]
MKPYAKYIWLDGRILKWEDAKIHVLTHALHYGTSIFEGIRGYWNGDNLLVFRLEEHIDRMYRSAKILGINIPYTREEVRQAVLETIKANNFREDVYIRPVAFVASQTVTLDIRNLEVSLAVIVFPFGKYLSPNGIKATIVSWRRVHNTMLPVMAKIGGIYVNSVLALVEARSRGFDEALLMDVNGYVVEGSGENIFIVRGGRLFTPPVHESILEGITRDTVIKLSGDVGLRVEEKPITREEVYTADEVFLVGTAAEITPVVEVDGRTIGTGKPGPITTKIAELYSNVVRGKVEKYLNWITPVY